MKSISELFRIKEEAIMNKDVNLYMSTVTDQDTFFRNEQYYWINDMIKDEITDVVFTVKNIDKMNTDYVVHINQRHKLHGEQMDFNYSLLLKNEEGIIKDYGVYFNVIDKDNYQVKYIEDTDTALIFSDIVHQALEDLKNLFEIELEETLELKLFHEPDLVRQRSGPSYRWSYPLWASPNQSIKIYQYMYEDPSQLIGGIQHELIHTLTLKGNTQNVMQWMAEGFALKYGNDRYDLRHIDFSLQFLDEQDLAVSLKDLFLMKLSNYTEMSDITRYYNICFSYFDYLDTISDPKSLLSLFTFITNQKPIEREEDMIHLTEEVFIKIIGMSLNELSDGYLKWYQNKIRGEEQY